MKPRVDQEKIEGLRPPRRRGCAGQPLDAEQRINHTRFPDIRAAQKSHLRQHSARPVVFGKRAFDEFGAGDLHQKVTDEGRSACGRKAKVNSFELKTENSKLKTV